VEELLLGGLTAASKSTVERMDVTFKEASRMKLLRLGSTLRIANEEISRFTAGSPQFSARRLSFFLSRAWVLAVGMGRAFERADAAQLGRLMATPASEAVGSVRVITLGVTKRVVSGAFATFEFRLRATEDSAGGGPARAGAVRAGEALVWSCVFPMRQGLELPAEAFLHLPQKQKFKPSVLLERKVVEITRCAVSRPATSAARLTLTDASEVKPLAPFTDWAPLWQWRPRDAGARVEHYRPTPVDLEVELQEEVFVPADWQPGDRRQSDEGYDALPIRTGPLEFEARLDRGTSGVPLNAVVTKLAEKKTRPALYGVMHYEACAMVLQPLTAMGKDGPEYLTVSPEKISQAELVKAMKFT